MDPEEVITKISLGLEEEDVFLVISDKENRFFGKKVKDFASKICKTFYLELEEFGRRPLLKYPEEMRKRIEEINPTASCYLAKSREGEISFRISLIDDLVNNFKVKHAHMPGIDEKIWNSGLRIDYRKVKRITERVLSLVKESKEIEVYSERGTEVYVKGFYNWVPDKGVFKKGEWGNLPAGEVFTCPKRIEGKFFAEILGDYFIKYGKLKEPVVFYIESSEVVEIRCKKDTLRKDLEKYIFEGPKNSTRVGEFAIGTNVFLKEVVGNLLQDEKLPGVHIAFGNPFPGKTGAPWNCDVHLDLISLKTDVLVDNKKIMERGRFVGEIL